MVSICFNSLKSIISPNSSCISFTTVSSEVYPEETSPPVVAQTLPFSFEVFCIKNLFSAYDERIVSRFVGSYNICRFFGDDIRFKKK